MTLQLNLPPETERRLRERAALTGEPLEVVVRSIVTDAMVDEGEHSLPMTKKEFAEELERWIALHPVLDHPIDDSRESIYAGRGE